MGSYLTYSSVDRERGVCELSQKVPEKKSKTTLNFLLLQSLNKAQKNTLKGGIAINDYTSRVLAPIQYADYSPMLGDT